MSPAKVALIALGLATIVVAGARRADAAPGTAGYHHPSALGPGTLVYRPQDVSLRHAKGVLGDRTPDGSELRFR